jgi:hypothetical protein
MQLLIIRRRCEVHGSTDLFDGKFKHGSINGGENCEESHVCNCRGWNFACGYLQCLVSDLRLVLTDRPLIKLDFASSKSSLLLYFFAYEGEISATYFELAKSSFIRGLSVRTNLKSLTKHCKYPQAKFHPNFACGYLQCLVSDLRLVLTDRPLIKLDFASSKSIRGLSVRTNLKSLTKHCKYPQAKFHPRQLHT